MLTSINETGRLLGVSRGTVYKMIHQKSIEAVHVRRRRLVTISSINKYISNQAVPLDE